LEQAFSRGVEQAFMPAVQAYIVAGFSRYALRTRLHPAEEHGVQPLKAHRKQKAGASRPFFSLLI